ncbi:glucosyl transferase [Serinicoccus sp. CUA-874]|uniref:glycosyltransferase family 2 protein n=1 Tax=Serinicoccus sp. CUA-874 TaxID=1517939 RepID=UPI000962D343|nr:glycosyltransferase family 2 protein [Serinicoccus sp. CUA-874]OLT15594.1 glucosyl transferase [Serinicoccus sp. CUA-874]
MSAPQTGPIALSVVVPMFDEQDVLPLLVQRLRPVLDGLGLGYEVVAVDDGSSDATPVLLARERQSWAQLRVVRLRANAGHQAAISAGLERARGELVVTIDADLQDPPELIADMVRLARAESLDVVYAVRDDRTSDTRFKRVTASGYYDTMRRLGADHGPSNAGDYRLMSRATVEAVTALPEHHRVLRLVVPSLGFPSGVLTYRRDARAAGRSKYPLSSMVRLALDSITGASIAPLRLATWLGFVGAVVALGLLVYALVGYAVGLNVPGWTSTFMVVTAVGGVQLLCLGILGEYVGRTYTMQLGRPTYYVADDSLSGQEPPPPPGPTTG